MDGILQRLSCLQTALCPCSLQAKLFFEKNLYYSNHLNWDQSALWIYSKAG